jgi:hypothetical protein
VKSQYAAGFEVFFAQGRAAFHAGALIEMSIDIDEALSEGLLVVRVRLDDMIGIGGTRKSGCDEN